MTVNDLVSVHSGLKSKGAQFKNEITEGQGGKQVLLLDPSGNLVELFEAKKTGHVQPVPDGYHTVTPFLLADDVTQLLTFIEKAFSGKIQFSMKSADGVVRHATIKIGNSLVMTSSGTEIYGSMPCMLHLYTENVDALYAQAIKAGATSLREPRDEFYGDRTAAVVDKWKNQWWIATHIEDVPPQEMQMREAEFRSKQAR
jgi:PhnB protein